ncbi:MAG TPA: hypothetical protein VF528_18215 [Pyrinomonadaceae bacterium]
MSGARCALFISLCCVALLFLCTIAACTSSPKQKHSKTGSAGASGKKQSKTSAVGGDDKSVQPKVLARLEDASIDESSGLVASRRNGDMFWTHNDSGDDPFIFAFNRSGKRRGVWRVEGAKARDWEDIAIGPGPERNRPYLYIGDIGDNRSARKEIIVYRVPEPAVEDLDDESSRKNPRLTEMAEVIRVQYPDGAHDAEALMVHPMSGDIYIATKSVAPSAFIYKLSAPVSVDGVNTLIRVGEVSLPTPFATLITGGDISPDGQRVVLCDYFGAYELHLAAATNSGFDTIWEQPVVETSLGPRGQGEAVCYRLDGAAILATSEGRNSPLIEVELRPPAKASAAGKKE